MTSIPSLYLCLPGVYGLEALTFHATLQREFLAAEIGQVQRWAEGAVAYLRTIPFAVLKPPWPQVRDKTLLVFVAQPGR